jgi:hypothetical protein
MAKRIQYNAWGSGVKGVKLPTYCLLRENDSDLAAVCKAIERATCFTMVTMRSDGHNSDCTHWQGQLGKALKSGGYSGEGEVWISLPRTAKES